MLVVAQCGVLDAFHTFDCGGSLARRVSELERFRPELGPIYAAFLERELDPEVRRALRRLLARSRRWERRHPIKRAWKRLRRLARGAPVAAR